MTARKPARPRQGKARSPRARRPAASDGRASVDAYLARVPPAQRAALQRLRAQIHAAAPGATERIAYGIPTFALDGRNLVHMAAFRAHLSFFPGRAGVTAAMARKLAGHTTAKGTIRFTPERPLPAGVVREIVRLRVREARAKAN